MCINEKPFRPSDIAVGDCFIYTDGYTCEIVYFERSIVVVEDVYNNLSFYNLYCDSDLIKFKRDFFSGMVGWSDFLDELR